jgi:hypothetical protein
MSIDQKTSSRFWYLSLLALIVMIVVVTWVNYRFSLQNPGGNDFLVHWVGTRSFIMDGISPYSEATALKIQTMAYGRPADFDDHELRVAYPFYSEIFYAPFSLIPNFTLARAFWMTFLELVIFALAIVSFRLVGWQPSFWLLPVYLIFSLFWYHGLRVLINGNAVALVTFLILPVMISIRNKSDVAAGVLLAFATIKPHLVVLLILFIILWAISHQRWVLIGWIFGGLITLIILGMAFIPDWLLQNVWEIMRFPDYNPPITIGSAFETWWPGIGTQLKWGLTIILLILIIFEWRVAWGKGFNHFLWTACLTIAISQWIGIATDPGNFIILFLPLVLIFSIIKERWTKGGDWIILAILTFLFIGLWILFLNSVEMGDQPQQSAVMFVPMPLFVLVGLYWIRWWVIRPTRKIAGISSQTT